MATHFSILAWKIPWTEKPHGLWFTGSKRVQDDTTTKQQQYLLINLVGGNSFTMYCV